MKTHDQIIRELVDALRLAADQNEHGELMSEADCRLCRDYVDEAMAFLRAEWNKPAQPADDARDAARYRWLRANAYMEFPCDSPRAAGWSDDNTDANVDAAIAAQAQKGEQ